MTGSRESRVVIGYDDTPAAAAAVAFAAHECRLRDAALVVIHQTVGVEVPDYRTSARAEAEQLARVERSVRDAVATVTSGLDVDVRITERPIARSLVDVGSAAAVIVLGADVRHASLGFALDSVARTVVHDAPCPVILVPAANDGSHPIERIVCGVNRSAASAAALSWAAREAALREAPLKVVEVAGPPSAEEVPLGEWVIEQLPEPRCDVTWSSTTGATARTLLGAAGNDGLLVIGQHEPHRRLWQRSVARSLIAQTRAPVVVVPNGVRARVP